MRSQYKIARKKILRLISGCKAEILDQAKWAKRLAKNCALQERRIDGDKDLVAESAFEAEVFWDLIRRIEAMTPESILRSIQRGRKR